MSELPKNYEELQVTLSKENNTVKEAFSEINEELKTRYGIEKHTRLNISTEELNTFLKTINTNLSNKNSLKANLKSAIYDEFIETKLEEKDWIKEISIDKVSENIDNTKMIESKKILNEYIDNFTKKYDFLWNNEKEIFRLAIANKLINSISPLKLDFLSNKVNNILTWKIENIEDIINEENNKVLSEIQLVQKNIENILTPYNKLFDKINKDLDQWNYKNKINIISNINWFHNPLEIEKYNWEELIFNYEKVKNTELNNKIENIEDIKNYLITSRKKIEQMGEQMKNWEKMKKNLLNIISIPKLWKHIEWVLSWFLKIPFLWKLISVFLGLSPNNPMESLNSEKETFSTYKSLQSFWTKTDKNWKSSENTDSKIDILKDKDLSNLDYEKLKANLEYINSLTKNDKNIKSKDDLLIQLFSKEWYKWLKLDITKECFTNNKVNKDFYKTFEKSIDEHKNIEVERKNKENLENEKNKKLKISKLENNLKEVNFILSDDFIDIFTGIESINWINELKKIDDIIQFKSISIKDLPKNKNEISSFLSDKLWAKDWNDELKTIQWSLVLFIEKLIEYKDKDKLTNVGQALKEKDKILKEYKENLENEVNKLDYSEKIKTKIISVKWDLSKWIEENWLKIKLNWNKLTINDKNFSIELANNIQLKNIILEENIAIIEWKNNIWLSWEEKIDKNIVWELISQAISNWKTEYYTSKGMVTIKKA